MIQRSSLQVKKDLRQFEIYNVDLGITKGSEQRGIRPCLILQTNVVAHVAPTIMIAPLTSKRINKIYPYEVFIEGDKLNGLKVNSKIMIDQMRVIDKSRIKNRIGSLKPYYHSPVFGAMDILFDRLGDFR